MILKKRIVSILFLLLLVFPLIFSACGPQAEPFTPRQELDQATMGGYDPIIKITYARPWFSNMTQTLYDKGWTMEDNNWTSAIRADLGIKMQLVWSIADSAEYFVKLTGSIASGAIPDITNIHTAPSAYDYLQMLENNDLLTNIRPYYEQYASDELKECYELAGEEVFYPATFGGEIKALCSILGSENDSWSFYWIRKDWLDNLNMQVPTTFDEFVEVIKAFHDKDPDNDGINGNTYGIPFDASFFAYGSTIFNSHHAYLNTWIELEDGTLGFGSIQPEAKEALSTLRELYAGGYLDPEMTNYETAVKGGKCGIWPGQVHNGLFLQPVKDKNSNADFVPIRLLSVDDEEARPQANINSYQYYTVNPSCKNPEVLVKLLNYYLYIGSLDSDDEYKKDMFTDENAAELWQFAPVTVSKVGENFERAKKVAEALNNGTKENLKGTDADVYDWVMAYRSGDNSQWGWDKIYGGEQSSEYLMGHYIENGLYMTNKFVGNKSDNMQATESDLNLLITDGFLKIIRGEEPLDYFDVIVDSWENMGGKENTEYVNDWYENVKG